jgi:sensor domain CHASE-containing protein
VGPAIASALIASANEVIDLAELRLASYQNYLPAAIIALLVVVAAMAVGFFGWSFGAADRRSLAAQCLLAFLITAVIATIVDLSRPHRGLMHVSDTSLVRAVEATSGQAVEPTTGLE